MNKKVLVTGGNGFLALHIIAALLPLGYEVRTTLRSLNKQVGVITALEQNHVTGLEHLSFVQADLSKDAGWDAAMTGISFVMSVASPVFLTADHPKEMDRAATEGILRILKAAEGAHVQRVVMTANYGAIGFSNKDKHSVITEADWTNPDEPGLSPYEKSKLVAEQAAWHYIKKSTSSLEFTTVNPVAMLGPSLNQHVSGSFGIVKGLIDGSMKQVPNIGINLVDVRDVASLHIKAMQSPQAAGERFIASAEGQTSFPEMANLIRSKYPQLSAKIPSKIMPNWLINFAAIFSQQAKEGRLLMQLNRTLSIQKAADLLGWQPVYRNEEIVLATVNELINV